MEKEKIELFDDKNWKWILLKEIIVNLYKELNKLNLEKKFVLSGGTSLALKYKHRFSKDIDIF
ncbi:MAG: nucleotidyl transferase AbiEii/AbiGii toxin family protein, partial [Nanoarchaeota archaeon]